MKKRFYKKIMMNNIKNININLLKIKVLFNKKKKQTN